MSIITVRKATRRDIRSLSRKLLKLLEDKNGPIYMENVAKFDIPEEYVRKAFSEALSPMNLNSHPTRKPKFSKLTSQP
jgi:hypothetical protein